MSVRVWKSHPAHSSIDTNLDETFTRPVNFLFSLIRLPLSHTPIANSVTVLWVFRWVGKRTESWCSFSLFIFDLKKPMGPQKKKRIACLTALCRIYDRKQLQEGPEGIKLEVKFVYFFTGKMGFWSLGLGITDKRWEWDWDLDKK